MRTIYHQVRFPENQAIVSDAYYCAVKECTIGYFSIAGGIIAKVHIKTYKDIIGDKLCYCFDIDAAQYLSVLANNTARTIKNSIVEKTKS